MTRKILPDYPPPPKKALLSSYDPPSLGGSKMEDNFLQSPPFISCWLRLIPLIPHENHVFPPQENSPLIKNNLSSKMQSILIFRNQC